MSNALAKAAYNSPGIATTPRPQTALDALGDRLGIATEPRPQTALDALGDRLERIRQRLHISNFEQADFLRRVTGQVEGHAEKAANESRDTAEPPVLRQLHELVDRLEILVTQAESNIGNLKALG